MLTPIIKIAGEIRTYLVSLIQFVGRVLAIEFSFLSVEVGLYSSFSADSFVRSLSNVELLSCAKLSEEIAKSFLSFSFCGLFLVMELLSSSENSLSVSASIALAL